MSDTHSFRLATEADVPALGAIYASTVRELGPQLYTPEQVVAWSASPDNREAFYHFIMDYRTHIIEVDGAPAAFCGIGADGYVASLYVAPQYTRKGLGSKVLTHALEDARREFGATSFYTKASFFSREVFTRHGFYVAEEESVDYNGQTFRRFHMRREVAGQQDR
ncbi:MAG: GNAT family N-acetyltransferase [Candidatus Hydrogenedens sp.]|nr:GNAT family N-acetyltransferase [Candidatus Hydrogenedens sp.]